MGSYTLQHTGSQLDEAIANHTDTRDANATEADIIKNKIAYVNGEKIVGTLEVGASLVIYNLRYCFIFSTNPWISLMFSGVNVF